MPLQNESYGEHTHKKHGIDIDSLLQQEVIDNEKCFWNIAQCQTDSLNYFYHREEKRIASKIIRSHKTITSQDLVPLEGSLDASDRDSQKIRLLALEDLENLMLQIQDLMAFLDTSRIKFSHIVTKFDEHHGSDTASEEMETFELTYQFMNNGRLQSLKEYGERLVESCTAKIFDATELQVPQFFRTSFYGYSGKDLVIILVTSSILHCLRAQISTCFLLLLTYLSCVIQDPRGHQRKASSPHQKRRTN